MALTDVKVKNPSGEKQVKLTDGDGMYILITPAGESAGASSIALAARKRT
jgi:hypothetical protein